jgi:hypothetical protein
MVKWQSDEESSEKGQMIVQEEFYILLIIIVSGLLGQVQTEGTLLDI